MTSIKFYEKYLYSVCLRYYRLIGKISSHSPTLTKMWQLFSAISSEHTIQCNLVNTSLGDLYCSYVSSDLLLTTFEWTKQPCFESDVSLSYCNHYEPNFWKSHLLQFVICNYSSSDHTNRMNVINKANVG